MPTTNPVPSTDPSDLIFNAGKLDEAVNGTGSTYTDRLGVQRRSLAGINADADNVLNSIGYAVPVAYSSGISMTMTSQTVEYSGVVYAPKSSALPFTTSSWVADSAKFRAIQVTDAAYLSYTPAGTGAAPTTVQAKMRETVSVTDFYANGVSGAKVDPTGVIDSTLGIQAAINTGKDVDFLHGSYIAHGITQSTDFQRFYARGHVSIIKNADGALFTSTGNYVEFNGIQFIGTGFTGNNIVATGNNPRFINCSSFGAAGRALKATGGHVQVIGTCGSYTTTDTSATGYDIEIGVSGTATLYHELWGVYTSQATGGILLVDTGTHHILGGQFGKLTIKAGTTPAGSNGGMTVGARILGDVTVEHSNSVFSANQFSTVTITLAAGTGGHSIDASNNTINATIINNGNANSTIVKSIGTGSPVGMRLQYGSDAGNVTIRYATDEIYIEDSNLNFANNKAIKFADSTGTLQNAVTLGSADDWTFGSNNGANFTNVVGGTVGIFLVAGGTNVAQCTSSAFRATTDGVPNLGGASNRWNTVYASTGAINTSDEREKQDIAALDEAEKRVAAALKGMVKKFRFRDAVREKGDAARIHVGVIAQEVVAAFQAEGLDPMRYGILCYDEWEVQDAVTNAESGEIVVPAREAGSRYGVRYEELLAFIIAAL